MEHIKIVEIIGYFASLIIAISLMSRSVIRLRILNLIGALIFTFYGIIINSFPVAILNGFIVLINIYYIMDFFTKKEKFQFYFANYKNNFAKKFIDSFLELYHNDIKKYFPDFDFKIKPYHKILLFFRNLKPAGILILRPSNFEEILKSISYFQKNYNNNENINDLESIDSSIKKSENNLEHIKPSNEYEIRLDYVTPEYRDFKIGKFIFFENKDIFTRIGAKKIFIKTYKPAHIRYLKKMDFISKDRKKTVWEKNF